MLVKYAPNKAVKDIQMAKQERIGRTEVPFIQCPMSLFAKEKGWSFVNNYKDFGQTKLKHQIFVHKT